MKIELDIPPVEEQKRILYAAEVEKSCELLKANCAAPARGDASGIDPSVFGDAHLKTDTEGWEPPPAELVNTWFLQFKNAVPEFGTDEKLGILLGIRGAGVDRRIRAFRSGDKPVPYGIWRRFLVITGRVNQEIYPVIGFFAD